MTLLRHNLRRNAIDARVVHVGTPGAFLAAVEHMKPDVILADGNVPGFDTTAALQTAQGHCKDVPFYYLTGGVSEQRVASLLAAGAAGCLSKADAPSVQAAISSAIAGRRAIDGAAPN